MGRLITKAQFLNIVIESKMGWLAINVLKTHPSLPSFTFPKARLEWVVLLLMHNYLSVRYSNGKIQNGDLMDHFDLYHSKTEYFCLVFKCHCF